MENEEPKGKGTEPCCGGCEEQDGSCHDASKESCCGDSPKTTGASFCGETSSCCGTAPAGGSKLKGWIFLVVVLAAIIVGVWALRSDSRTAPAQGSSSCCPAGSATGSSGCGGEESGTKGESKLGCPGEAGSPATGASAPGSASAGAAVPAGR